MATFFRLSMLLLSATILVLLASNWSIAAEQRNPILEPGVLLTMQSDGTKLQVWDVRAKEKFVQGHVAGSRLLETTSMKELASRKEGLHDTKAWNAHLSQQGIDFTASIVLIGDNLPDTARIWWLLKFVGAPQVYVLNGTPDDVAKAGGKTSITTERPLKPTEVQIKFDESRLATADQVRKLTLDSNTSQLIDNRTEKEYLGIDVRGKRGGHVPKACNLDWTKFVGDDKRLRGRDELRKIVEETKIDLARPVITHCQSGGRSSVGALVFESITGKPAQNYYGSWADWSERDDLPVEK